MESGIVNLTPSGYSELAAVIMDLDNARYPKAPVVQGRNDQLFIALPKTVENEYRLKAGDIVEFSYLSASAFKVLPKK